MIPPPPTSDDRATDCTGAQLELFPSAGACTACTGGAHASCGAAYADLGADHFARRDKPRLAARLARKLDELGYDVTLALRTPPAPEASPT